MNHYYHLIQIQCNIEQLATSTIKYNNCPVCIMICGMVTYKYNPYIQVKDENNYKQYLNFLSLICEIYSPLLRSYNYLFD